MRTSFFVIDYGNSKHAASCEFLTNTFFPYKHNVFHVFPSIAGTVPKLTYFFTFSSTKFSSPSSDNTKSRSPIPKICPCPNRPDFHFRFPLDSSTHSKIPSDNPNACPSRITTFVNFVCKTFGIFHIEFAKNSPPLPALISINSAPALYPFDSNT